MLPKPDSCRGCPLYELPHGQRQGFSLPDGAMTAGVVIVGEALGRDEEVAGRPLVGSSGYTLFQELARLGLEREQFRILNVLSCRPPDNKLLKMPWEAGSISHCSPLLDKNLEDARKQALEQDQQLTIVTLGNTAFKRILEFEDKRDRELLKQDFYAYPFWSARYQAWVLNAPHPAFLLRGSTHLWPVVHFVFKRAVEIATHGLLYEDLSGYLLDPPANLLDVWAKGYEESLQEIPDNPLSYDIETPYKVKTKAEDDLLKEDELNDHTIIRISFSYFFRGRTHTVSTKWSTEFMATIEHLFSIAPFVLGWNSDKYDYPRVTKHVKIRGISLDGMVAWHILNTSLPKSLGFVTPYYWQDTDMWKHLSDVQPAFYNAKDADAALRNFMGIKRDLVANGLWHVYERHWIKLYGALKYMTGIGVLRDDVARDKAEEKLSGILNNLEAKMETAVPIEARKFKTLKKAPKALVALDKDLQEGRLTPDEHAVKWKAEGWTEIEQEVPVKRCSGCGKAKPGKSHFKAKPVSTCSICGKKWSAKHVAPRKSKPNLCLGGTKVERESNPCRTGEARDSTQSVRVWTRPLGFKLSKLGLTNYQKALRHQAILTRKEKKVTFNEDAIVLLTKKYPKDPLYPLILDYREASKLLGTYIGVKLPNGRLQGGMEVGPDGRIHTSFGRNASTLRFTSEDPNLQNLPRPNPKDPDDLANLVRNLIIASPGNTLYARDFSGIEAVLSGYFAGIPDYIRLAKRDVHTFYTVYAIYELEGSKRLLASDLPDLSWPDEKLFACLEDLKGRFKQERNNLYKHLVHAANFMQGAPGARDKIFSETGVLYPIPTVAKVMDVYYSLFPGIRRWHTNVLEEAAKDGYLRNPFGYVHRFSRVFDWKLEYGKWKSVPGPDANKAIAFKPQSVAVGIITEALLRLFYERFEEAGQFLRLQVHDELFFECPEDYVLKLDPIVKEEMERPVPELRLPPSWKMGDCLGILTEEKKGPIWGQMK